MTNITNRQLKAFLSVADAGSFTRAAERLHVAQPALSQQIRELEKELGIRLFDRTTRRVELTEGGREFRKAAAKIIEDLELAVRNAHGLADRQRGRVIVAAPPLLAAVVLPVAIADFRTKYPGIKIVVVDTRPDHIVDSVRSGEVDCGFGTFRSGEDGVSSTPLARDSLVLFCARGNPMGQASQVTWRDLDGLPLITLTRESGIRLLIEVGFESAEMSLAPVFEVSHVTTVLAMVEAGLGIAVLPTYAWAAARNRQLSAVPLIQPSITRDIVMITAAARSVSPAVFTFARFLSKHTIGMLPTNASPDYRPTNQSAQIDG